MNELDELIKQQKKLKYRLDLTELTEINKRIYTLREQQRKEHELKVEQAREERFARQVERKCFEIDTKKE